MPNTVNNNLPLVPENTIDPAAGLNETINAVDPLLQAAVLTVGDNSPPGSPTDGARYIVGTAPTGDWSGQSDKLAQWLDGAWRFMDARIVVCLSDNTLRIRGTGGWITV